MIEQPTCRHKPRRHEWEAYIAANKQYQQRQQALSHIEGVRTCACVIVQVEYDRDRRLRVRVRVLFHTRFSPEKGPHTTRGGGNIAVAETNLGFGTPVRCGGLMARPTRLVDVADSLGCAGRFFFVSLLTLISLQEAPSNAAHLVYIFMTAMKLQTRDYKCVRVCLPK